MTQKVERVLAEHKCSDCRFCDATNLMCYPESEDCANSYELTEEDLVIPGCCDFFKPIEQRKAVK